MNKRVGIIIIIAILMITLSVGGIYYISCNKKSEDKLIKHEHTFTEATCEDPITCKSCGITEGTSLGHTTNIGKCENCGEAQNEEISMEIVKNINLINENISNCTIEINSADLNSNIDCFGKFSSASIKIKNNNEYAKNIIELCGDYTELSDIKQNCNELLITDVNINSSDSNSLVEFLTAYKSYLLITKSLTENMSKLAKLYI